MAFATLQYGGWGGFRELFFQLEQMGVFDVLLPFILIFSLLFGVMQKVKVFGEDSKKYNAILSLAIALLVIVPHVTGMYPESFDLVDIINKVLPQVALILIAIVLFLIMVGIVWPRPDAGYSFLSKAATPITAALILLFIFGSAAYPQYRPSWLAWLGDPSLQMFVIIVLVVGLVIYFVTGGKSEEDIARDLLWRANRERQAAERALPAHG